MKNKVNLLVTFLLVFTSTQASNLAFSPTFQVICLIYVIHIFLQRGLAVDNFFINFTIAYYVILVIHFLYFGYINFYLSNYIYLKFLFAYMSIKIVGFAFFKYFLRIIFYGSVISIPLFIIQLIFYDELFSFIGILQNNIDFFSYRNDEYANLLFYTIDGYAASARNSGFFWEPKGFANVLVLSIIINYLLNKTIFNKYGIVFFIALITTFSTTGYISFLFILILIILNQKKFRTIVLILVIPAAFFVSQLDFMYEKIIYEFSLTEDYKKLLNEKRSFKRNAISLGRIGSFIVDFQDFQKKPILGYGFQREERTQNRWIKLVRVNGFSDLLVTYGILGLIFYFISYKKFINKFFNFYEIKGKWIMILIFTTIYFASTLTAHPLWMSFLFIHKVIPKKL